MSYSTTSTVGRLRATSKYYRNSIPKIHYVITRVSYDETMSIIDDIAAKNINQPISIDFGKLVKKINYHELITKLANIRSLTSINLPYIVPHYTLIQPLLSSGKILDLGIRFNDEKIFERSTQLTKLVLTSMKNNLATFEKYASLRELEYFRVNDDQNCLYEVLPNPTLLTKLTVQLSGYSGYSTERLTRLSNLKVLNVFGWRSAALPTQPVLLPNLESLSGLCLKMDMKTLSHSTKLTTLKVNVQTPKNADYIVKLTNLRELSIAVNSQRDLHKLTCLAAMQFTSLELSGIYGPPLINYLNTSALFRLSITLPHDSPHFGELTRMIELNSLSLAAPRTRNERFCPKFNFDMSNFTSLTQLIVNIPQMLFDLQLLTVLEYLHFSSLFMKQGVISNLTNLTFLHVKTVEDFEQLSKLTKLQSLHETTTTVADGVVLPLVNLTNLTLRHVKSVDLLQLPKLEMLELHKDLEPSLLLELSALTKLTRLAVGLRELTDQVKLGYPFILMTRLQSIVVRSEEQNNNELEPLLIDALPLLHEFRTW